MKKHKIIILTSFFDIKQFCCCGKLHAFHIQQTIAYLCLSYTFHTCALANFAFFAKETSQFLGNVVHPFLVGVQKSFHVTVTARLLPNNNSTTFTSYVIANIPLHTMHFLHFSSGFLSCLAELSCRNPFPTHFGQD